MTRPRCPKCQKYYVTQTCDQRPLTRRTAEAIMRVIQREAAPISPYQHFQCDICGHRWAVLVAPEGTTSGAPAFGAYERERILSLPRTTVPSAPKYAGVSGRRGTLMAAHPAVSQRLRRPVDEDARPTAHRIAALGTASSARAAKEPPAGGAPTAPAW